MPTRDLFHAPAVPAAEHRAGVPAYRGMPLARREHILERPALLDVLTDTPDRLVVRYRLFGMTDTWERVLPTPWFERTGSVASPASATEPAGTEASVANAPAGTTAPGTAGGTASGGSTP